MRSVVQVPNEDRICCVFRDVELISINELRSNRCALLDISKPLSRLPVIPDFSSASYSATDHQGDWNRASDGLDPMVRWTSDQSPEPHRQGALSILSNFHQRDL